MPVGEVWAFYFGAGDERQKKLGPGYPHHLGIAIKPENAESKFAKRCEGS